MNAPRIEPLGDGALLVRLGDEIDAGLNERVLALAARIEAERPVWLQDCAPAYSSLAIFIDGDRFAPTENPLADAREWLSHLIDAHAPPVAAPTRPIVDIPVHYGGESGPDLEVLAAELAMPADELIARHCAPTYRVAMLGFAPGFPYLLGLDPTLASPRLATPRQSVPAGSVGIGGKQTGVYPCAGPGGWRLLGRTPTVLFDAHRESPSLLQPGDRVRFVAAGRGP